MQCKMNKELDTVYKYLYDYWQLVTVWFSRKEWRDLRTLSRDWHGNAANPETIRSLPYPKIDITYRIFSRVITGNMGADWVIARKSIANSCNRSDHAFTVIMYDSTYRNQSWQQLRMMLPTMIYRWTRCLPSSYSSRWAPAIIHFHWFRSPGGLL